MSLAPAAANKPVLSPADRGWLSIEREGICHAVSDTVVSWLGCQHAESFFGRNWIRFVHPESEDAIHAAINRIQGHPRATSAPIRLRGHGGRSVHVMMRLVPWWYDTPKGPYPDGIKVHLDRITTGATACHTVSA